MLNNRYPHAPLIMIGKWICYKSQELYGVEPWGLFHGKHGGGGGTGRDYAPFPMVYPIAVWEDASDPRIFYIAFGRTNIKDPTPLSNLFQGSVALRPC